MNWGVFLFIMLTLIFIIVIIIFVSITQEKEYGSTCQIQTDCRPGYVCNNANLCIAGLGEACSDTKDCLDLFICSTESKTCVIDSVMNDEEKSYEASNIEDSHNEMKPKYVTRNIAHLYASVESTDDEMNSTGSMEDGVFDILSNESSSEKSSSLHDEKIFHSEYKDACMFGAAKIYLKKDNSIVIEHNEHKKNTIHNNNIHNMKYICYFGGNLYTLDGKGILYTLDISNVQEKYWEWQKVSWAPNKAQEKETTNAILWMSTPYDGSCLWLSTATHGYIYSSPSVLEKTIAGGENRRYGMDKNHFVSINNTTCKTYPEKKTYHSIKDAVLTHTNTVVTISDRAIENRVVLLDWVPVYLY
jgi:hypothetical protein